MGHHHHHNHAVRYDRAFALGTILNVVYIVTEAGFGLWIGSLALLSDAGHNLSDVLGLLMAWGAHALMRLRPTNRRTYGWRSTSIFAALGNALLLIVAVGALSWEAIRRLFDPPEVSGLVVLAVAAVGVVINTGTALLFLRGSRQDLNLRGAFLHMAADAAISGAVVVAGLIMYLTNAYWIDPLLSLVVGFIILYATWHLFTEAINLALHAVPSDVDVEAIRAYLAGLPGVTEVHDLHVWALSTTETALTVHLVIPGGPDDPDFASRVADELHRRYGIEHPTIQIESAGCSLVCHPHR